ncbi:MAG: hypothetical protein H6667_03115 [Ardenticatenaceae bacterium]|nr:hypothetical protein [Ardenticatenaceae bacterium]MCB9443000.1 hypothetical protein [Ardenticatenaceae bacterium]
MEEIVQTIVKQMSRKLGGQLEAIFLYGSMANGSYKPGESDINLLAVIADGTSIHALRKLFLPIWNDYKDVLCRAPLIAQEKDFARYLQVAPTFAHHLIHQGEIVFGLPDYLDGWPETNPYDASARLAYEAMQVSAAIAPELLEPEIAQAKFAQLYRLARKLHGQPIDKGKTAVELYALVQHYLNQQIANLPNPPAVREPSTTTTMLLPGLQASYKEADQMVMVFQELTPHQIMAIQWPILAKRVANRCTGLRITTAVQLKLIMELERPLDIVLQRYHHEWGDQLLAQIKPAKKQIFRQAARFPAEIQIDLMPNDYLTQDQSKIHDIIHDYQNKLLNIQLEHELLRRLQQINKFEPPELLPDRTAHHSVRIDAIFKHLGWWSEFYTDLMLNAE